MSLVLKMKSIDDKMKALQDAKKRLENEHYKTLLKHLMDDVKKLSHDIKKPIDLETFLKGALHVTINHVKKDPETLDTILNHGMITTKKNEPKPKLKIQINNEI